MGVVVVEVIEVVVVEAIEVVVVEAMEVGARVVTIAIYDY